MSLARPPAPHHSELPEPSGTTGPIRAAFVNLFPRELVTESISRMLTYALMLGLAGQVGEAHAWLQRAQIRISDEAQAQAKDIATPGRAAASHRL